MQKCEKKNHDKLNVISIKRKLTMLTFNTFYSLKCVKDSQHYKVRTSENR